MKAVMKKVAVAHPKVVEAGSLLDRIERLYRKVRERAHEFFESRERKEGKALDDWLEAEAEFFSRSEMEMVENDDSVLISFGVDRFKPEEIEISVESFRLIVFGSRRADTSSSSRTESWSRHRSTALYHNLSLPVEVLPGQATARLENGRLNVMLPKAVGRPIEIEVGV